MIALSSHEGDPAMSEGDSAMEQARNDHKFWGKHKWRGKLFSSEEKEGQYLRQKGNLDDGVADFLHSSNENTSAGQQQNTLQPRAEISTSLRWPSAAQVSKLSAEMPLYPRRKPPRNKNLHVTFESAAPEIIGEGGDEAELPSLEISRSRKSSELRPYSHDQPGEQAAKSVSPLRRQDPVPGTVAQAVPSVTQAPELLSLRKKPARAENARNNDCFHTEDSGTGEGNPNSVAPFRADVPPEPQLDAQDGVEYTSRSENRTTSAVRKGFRVGVEAPSSQPGTTRLYENADTRRQEDTSFLNLSSLEPALPMGNSLTPIPSPRPAQRPAPASYPFPSSRQVETTSPQTVSATTLRQYHPLGEGSPIPGSEARPSLKRVAKNIGDDAIEDFGARVQRFNEVFRLGTTASNLLIDISFAQWTRTCAWWFLKGRQELESAVRGRPRSGDGSHSAGDVVLSPEIKQAYLDLAKAWWISKKIIPNHAELRKYGDASMSSLVAIVGSFGKAELAEVIEMHLGITANMRALAMSMKRNNKLPPDDFEIHRLVSRVWIQYPSLSATTRSLLSGRNPRSLASAMPDDVENILPITVGDTRRYFNYGNIFVEASLNDGQAQLRLPCILTILRGRSGFDLDFTMASQDGQVNIVVQNSRKAGLTWEDVHWKVKMYIMQITLTDHFTVDVQFSEKDFKSLWGIRNYTQEVLKGFQCGETEKFVFETNVKCFQFFGPKGPQMFPAEPIKACKVRLFEKTVVFFEGTGKRRVHDGHRLMVLTPSTVKTLSSIACNFGKQTPVLFTYLRGEDDAPAMLLKSLESGPDSSMVINFQKSSERRLFHALLDGTSMTNEECCSACMPLKGLLISPNLAEEASSRSKGSFLADFRWHQLRVLGRNHEDKDHGEHHTLRSENLRVWADSDMGTFVDRINLGPGEIQIGLDVNNRNQCKMLRPPQENLTCSFADNLLPRGGSDALTHDLQRIGTSTTVRLYDFQFLTDLHTFQASVTGFSVVFDGLARNFGVSRRRMVVPIYKRWEASLTRLQIVKQDKTVQLVAFFRDFAHGSCMNFVLKGTDVFETFSRSGTFYLRIADAKFALPKGEEDSSKAFVSLDTPEYPGEHDDVTIEFDTEAERDEFSRALPAATTKFSRLGSLRRER